MALAGLFQGDFGGGVIAEALSGRIDLQRRGAALRRGTNVVLTKAGQAKVRPGWELIATLPARADLFAWQHRDGDVVVAIQPTTVGVYSPAGVLQSFDTTAPGSTHRAGGVIGDLGGYRHATTPDKLLILHDKYVPFIIERRPSDNNSLNKEWAISKNDIADLGLNLVRGKFTSAPGRTITLSGGTSPFSVTIAEPYFVPGHVGADLLINGAGATITAVSLDGKTAFCTSGGTIPAPLTTTDWGERIYSDVRGFPTAAAFHQGRLIYGGGRESPDTLIMSKAGNVFLFDPVGTADDDPIRIKFGVAGRARTRNLVSGTRLLILTDEAEFTIEQTPIAPSTVTVARETNRGSADAGFSELHGSTLFLQAARAGIGQEQPVVALVYDDTRQSHIAIDLTVLAQGLIGQPVQLAASVGSFLDGNDRVFVRNSAGDVSCINLPALERPGVTLFESVLTPVSIAAGGGWLYCCALFNGSFRLFRMGDYSRTLDASTLYSGAPTTTITGLSAYNGQTVAVHGDGEDLGDFAVSGGQITLPHAVAVAEIGKRYSWELAPANLEIGGARWSEPRSVPEVTVELFQAADVRVATLRADGSQIDAATIAPPDTSEAVSGVVRAHLVGWEEQMSVVLFGDKPFPAEIRAVRCKVQS